MTTRFAYDGQDVWADLDGSNNVKVRYLRGDVVDQVFARSVAAGQTNAGVAWYLTDRLGSVRDLMDGSQAVRDHLDYGGFGVVTESVASFGDRYKFTGREYDPDAGLQYNRARFYDQRPGRWISEDPIGFGGNDSNLSRYVGNEPSDAKDPSGLSEWIDYTPFSPLVYAYYKGVYYGRVLKGRDIDAKNKNVVFEFYYDKTTAPPGFTPNANDKISKEI